MADKYDLSVVLRVLDRASAPLSKIGSKFRQLTKPVDAANRRVQALGKSLQKAGKGMSQVGRNMSMKLTLPLTIMAGLATKASIDFETAFTGVRKTVNATEEEFGVLKKGLMDLARVIPISTTEIFGIAEAGGQLGQKQEDLLGFTKTMADLGATTNMSAEEAAISLARFANVVGVPVEDIERLGSVIVDLGNNVAANEKEIVEMGGRLSKAGKYAGLSAADIMSFSAALTSIGINAEAGGTAFSQVMLRIGKELGSGSEKMRGFAYVSGMTVKDFETLWKEDAAEAMLKFTEGLSRLKKEGENVSLTLDDLGMDGARIATTLLGAAGSGDKFRKVLVRGSKAWKENLALTKEANLRYATTASRLHIAMNKVRQMAAAFGDILKRALISVIDWLMPVIDWLRELSPVSKKVILVIGGIIAVIGPLLIALGFIAVAFGGILAIATPAMLALALPIAAVALAMGAIGFAVIQLIRHWKVLKREIGAMWEALKQTKVIKFIISLFEKLRDIVTPFFRWYIKTSLLIAKTVFGPWIKLLEIIIGGLGKIGKFLLKPFKAILDLGLPSAGGGNEARKKIEDELEEERSKIARSEAGENVYFGREAKGREKSLARISELELGDRGMAVGAVAGAQNSKTEIDFKVSLAEGLVGTMEKPKKKKGDAQVRATSIGYVGSSLFG